MKGLLPPETIERMLRETGALGDAKASHFVTSVKSFRPLEIRRRAQDEFNFAFFDRALQRVADLAQKEFGKNFIQGCQVSRKDMQLTSLHKYRFREQALCAFLDSGTVAEPFLAYFEPETFFTLLNHYFGGVGLPSAKPFAELTKIEEAVFSRACASLAAAFQTSFRTHYETKLAPGRVAVPADEQEALSRYDYLIMDYVLHAGEGQYPFAFAVPLAFLKAVKKHLESQEREHRVTDPGWQKTVARTVLASDVEMKVNIGAFHVPFEKSFRLREGDVFALDYCGPEVVLSILGRPFLKGSIGTVGENYAVQVEEVLP